MVAAAKVLGLNPEPRKPAAELLENSLEVALKRNPIVKSDKLISQTMKVGCCHVIASEVEDALKAAVDSGKIADLGKGLMSTPERIEAEKEKGVDLQKIADTANAIRPARQGKEKDVNQDGKESAILDAENSTAKDQDASKDSPQGGKEQDVSAKGNTKPQSVIESILTPRPQTMIETILSQVKDSAQETEKETAKEQVKDLDKAEKDDREEKKRESHDMDI